MGKILTFPLGNNVSVHTERAARTLTRWELTTPRRYVEALDGRLKVTAVFHDNQQ